MDGAARPVIFFDGYCGLCNGFVDFVIARDPGARILFAPLQGETAAARIPGDAVPAVRPGAEGPAPRSLVLWLDGSVYRKSDAVLRALPRLGGVWRAAAGFLVVPRFIRDSVYDFIARNRYRWFGKLQTCRMPDPGERERFLA